MYHNRSSTYTNPRKKGLMVEPIKIDNIRASARTFFLCLNKVIHMPILHCNNTDCKYNHSLDFTANPVHYVDRLCITFRRKPHKDDYRDLMQPAAGICHRERGSMQKKSRKVHEVMPSRMSRPCKFSGCSALTDTGYCVRRRRFPKRPTTVLTKILLIARSRRQAMPTIK